MARTITLSLLTLLIGLLIGAFTVRYHHQKLWRKKMDLKKNSFFESQGLNTPKFDRLPPELIEKTQQTIHLPESQLATQIEALPFYQNLSLEERSKLMDRLHRFRQKQIELAEQKIQALGLHLNENQKTDFQKKFFEKRRINRQSLQLKSKEWMQSLEQITDEELRKEFAK